MCTRVSEASIRDARGALSDVACEVRKSEREKF